MPDDIQQVVRTRELRLTDAAGNDRAVLTTADDGNVTLQILDGEKSPRVRLSVGKSGETKILLGKNDPAAVSLGVEADGGVLLELTDSEGIQRVKIDMKGNGRHTELSFSERNRKPRMVLMAEDKGPAGLFILDQYGKALFSTTP
jgi:hypothetical protein